MLTLILGGARSGKSDFAQRLVRDGARSALFVATMEPGDDEAAAAVAPQRARQLSSMRRTDVPRRIAKAASRTVATGSPPDDLGGESRDR